MGSVIPIQTQVETKQGEILVTINLNLNIKADMVNGVSVEANAVQTHEVVPDLNKVRFEKPDFEDNSEIIEFGKHV